MMINDELYHYLIIPSVLSSEQGYRVFITQNAKPGKEILACLVKAVHGQVTP